MVKLRFDTDLGGSLKAHQDLAKAVEKIGGNLTLSAREAKKLEVAAANIVKANEGPQERYNRKLGEYAKLVKAGTLSVGEAEKATERARRTFERTEATQQKVFGPQALSMIGSYVSSIATIGAAVQAVTTALQEMDQTAEAAAQRAIGAIGATGELAQVAEGPQDLAAAKGLGKDLRRRGIATDATSAQNLVFQMRSSGLSKSEQEDVFKLAESGLIASENIQPTARGAAKFRSAFGAKEAGSIEGILDKGVQASKGTSANLSQTLAASLEFAAPAAAQGISDEEALASLVVLEQKSKDISIAATQTKSLFESARKKGIQGNTVESLISNIETQIAGGKTAFQVLGRGEAVVAFDQLSKNRGEFVKQRDLISSADARNVAMASARMNASDPQLGAALAARRETGGQSVAEEDAFSMRRNLANSVRAARRRRAAESGSVNAFGESLGQWATSRTLTSWMMPDEAVIAGERRGGFQHVDPQTAEQIEKYLSGSYEEAQKQTRLLERMEATRAPGPSGRQE